MALNKYHQAILDKAQFGRKLKKGERASRWADRANALTEKADQHSIDTSATIDSRIISEYQASRLHAVVARYYEELNLPDIKIRHLKIRQKHINKIIELRKLLPG